MRVNNSDVILLRDDIAESRGDGVEFTGDSRGAIVASSVHNNGGAGIVVSDAAAPAIENNLVLENGAQPNGLRPGLLVTSSVHPVISGNIFGGNGAEAIWVPAPDNAILERNAFAFAGKADDRPKLRVVQPQDGRQ